MSLHTSLSFGWRWLLSSDCSTFCHLHSYSVLLPYPRRRAGMRHEFIPGHFTHPAPRGCRQSARRRFLQPESSNVPAAADQKDRISQAVQTRPDQTRSDQIDQTSQTWPNQTRSNQTRSNQTSQTWPDQTRPADRRTRQADQKDRESVRGQSELPYQWRVQDRASCKECWLRGARHFPREIGCHKCDLLQTFS